MTTPWFIATEPFRPDAGERWRKYVQWSGLTQLEELVSLDPILCPPVLHELKNDYWPHIVNEDFMLSYFVDLDFLRRQIADVARRNLLCVIRNPPCPTVEAPVEGFRFVGYDLVDLQNSASALSNCGGFPEVFPNSELSRFGLLEDFNRALEVQQTLRARFPQESHADCHLWAIFRE